MKIKWVVRGILGLMIAVILFAAFGQAVMHLWNWLMPEVFGLRTITYWQAIGLIALSWILLGRGFPGRRHFGGRRYGRGDWRRWKQMTPEQRAQFRETLHSWCAQPSAAPDPTSPPS